jgi:hypothetical protein
MCVLGALAADPFASAAQACPMCKAANETDANLPRAYMFSILFMLAVPATVVTSFGIGLYRLSRQRPEELPAEDASQSEDEWS